MSSRRHFARRSSRRRHRRQPVVRARDAGNPPVVDLTCDDAGCDELFVDLTDFDNSPLPNRSTSAVLPAASGQSDLQSPLLVSDGSVSNDDELPPVPFKIPTPSPRRKRSIGKATDNSSTGAFCPICLDSFSEVKTAGRRVMATTCGHVFCDECINGVLEEAGGKKCPTCRKKLTARSVHPLFI